MGLKILHNHFHKDITIFNIFQYFPLLKDYSIRVKLVFLTSSELVPINR